MYVRKFEGESLDEALKKVKSELGPDAIILKTITNNGLKGAFKKSKIEITAAISEQNYIKKAKVDRVMDNNQKENFYKAPAASINHMINEYDHFQSKKPAAGYGNLGLNKVVNTVSKTSEKIKSSLDDFLNDAEEPQIEEKSTFQERSYIQEPESSQNFSDGRVDNLVQNNKQLESLVQKQSIQIDVLEKKLFELTEKLTHENVSQREPKGMAFAKSTLRSLDISEKIISNIVKKMQFELSEHDLESSDLVNDFILRELNEHINTERAKFSEVEDGFITVLLSESSTGQSSMAVKMAILQENAHVICFREDKFFEDESLASKLYNLEVFNTSTLSELMAQIRKSYAAGKKIVVDLKLRFKESDESKKFIETLKRSYEEIEFLVNISAIQEEKYNRKILSKYKNFVDGVIINYIDQCVSFGSIINLHFDYNDTPLKFFGTGYTAPDDIEGASAERLLCEMFDL